MENLQNIKNKGGQHSKRPECTGNREEGADGLSVNILVIFLIDGFMNICIIKIFLYKKLYEPIH